MQKTYYPKAAEIEHKWYVADAAGQNLGRLASRVAHALLGKHKPSFTPGVQGGDYVVVINAEQVTVTGTRTSLEAGLQDLSSPLRLSRRASSPSACASNCARTRTAPCARPSGECCPTTRWDAPS